MAEEREKSGQGRGEEPVEGGYGDDQGTRVGRPSSPDRESDSSPETGAGAESARGIHAQGSGEEIDRTAEESGAQDDGSARSGSEPLRGRQREHVSGYGGAADKPKTSSDQREPLDPEGGAEVE
jgi:hypothetical protein